MTRQRPQIAKFVLTSVLASAALWAFAAPGASAEVTFCPTGSDAGQCSNPPGLGSPQGLATDFEEERLYVADSGNNRVNVFEVTGGGEVSFLFAFGWKVNASAPAEELQKCTAATGCQKGSEGAGSGQLPSPTRIAVDNGASGSKHAIYVTDANRRVQKFGMEGNYAGVSFGSPGSGAGQFESIRGIGVSGDGTVYVADTQNEGSCPLGGGSKFRKRVQKFSSAGAHLATVEPTDVPCGQISGFTVDSAGRYWVASEEVGKALRRYAPAGAEAEAGCTVDVGVETRGLGVDETDHLFAAQFESTAPAAVSTVVTELDASCAHLKRFGYGEIAGLSVPPGLALLPTAGGDVFASEAGSGRRGIAYLTTPATAGPIAASAGDPLFVGNTWATVRAFVNPEGKATEYFFEYVTDADYDKDVGEGGNGFEGEGVKSTPATALVVPSGKELFANPTAEVMFGCETSSQEELEDEVEAGNCLLPQTEYHWRVVATNVDNTEGEGAASKEGEPFTTKAAFEAEVFATDVGTGSATLNAALNPLGIPATGFFEYVSEADFQQSGFAEAIRAPDPLPPESESELDFGGGEGALRRSVSIGALKEGTTYRYRLNASNLLLAGLHSEAKVITTYRAPQVESCHGNAEHRGGAAALLPDCRAYELVSPLDKAGGDIIVLLHSGTNRPATLVKSAASGERLTYGTYRAFAGSPSAPYTAQYLAERSAGGWASHGISPPKGRGVRKDPQVNNEYFWFSEDLCKGGLTTYSEPVLSPGAQPAFNNIYVRDDELCEGAPDYTAATTAPAASCTGSQLKVEQQGFSADGAVAAFAATDSLTGSGAPAGKCGEMKLYAKAVGSAGPPRFACVLPGGAAASPCSAGSGFGSVLFTSTRNASTENALSEDGSRLYWSDAEGIEGKIYLRSNPLAKGTECSGSGAPCTVAVSAAGEAMSGKENSHFWGAAADGSRALFSTGGLGGAGDLYLFGAAGATTEKIAGKSFGVVGASEDLTRVYFASGEAIAGASGAGTPQVGEPNLYLYEGAGSYRFIATLAGRDVLAEPSHQNQSSATAIGPLKHNGQVSGDGTAAAFMSEAPLTGFDNTDASSTAACGQSGGICDTEVFVYDAGAEGGAGELRCVSCNAGGARPEGRNVGSTGSPAWTSGRLPVYESTLYQPRALAASGRRLVFESQDPLVPRDSNGRFDVYQWERSGTGRCEEADPTYSEQAGGCVDLISSGQSERDSELIDADATGANVFFTTLSSLLPYDYGLVDVYDARVGGGLPEPDPQDSICEGEACQGAYVPPEDPSPSSATFEGAGNVVVPAAKPKCRKGKVRRRGRCVPKRRAQQRKQAQRKQRAERKRRAAR